MQVCERQAETRSMHIQYSYNSNVSILLVSLLSRASGSLRTTPFHFFKKCFYTCSIMHSLIFFIVVNKKTAWVRAEWSSSYQTNKVVTIL